MDLGIIFVIVFVLITLGTIYYFTFMVPQQSFSSQESYNNDNENENDEESSEKDKDKDNQNLILIIYKSGGIMGMIYHMEIYSDRTYRLFDHDKVKRQGKLDSDIFKSAIYLVKKFPELKDKYCETDGNDMIYHGMKVGNRSVSLGTLNSSFEKCLPDDIMDNYDKLDKLMVWEPEIK